MTLNTLNNQMLAGLFLQMHLNLMTTFPLGWKLMVIVAIKGVITWNYKRELNFMIWKAYFSDADFISD